MLLLCNAGLSPARWDRIGVFWKRECIFVYEKTPNLSRLSVLNPGGEGVHLALRSELFPESVCEGFLLKISCGIRLLIIIIIVISSSASSHHHLIIIIIFSSHLLIIISPSSSSSSSFPSLSLAFLFFSNLAQPSSPEKRARCNPSQGKCVSSVKNWRVFAIFEF